MAQPVMPLPIINQHLVVDSALGTPAYYARNCCRFIDHHRLAPGRFHDIGVADIIAIYCKGNFLREHFQNPERYSNSVALTTLCGEYGGLRAEMTQADARTNFIRAIRYYIIYGERMTPYNRNIPEGEQRVAATNCATQLALVNALNNHDVHRVTQAQIDVDLPRTIEEAYAYARTEAATKRDDNQIVDVTSVIVTVITSLARQGNMTEDFIIKTQQACLEQFGRRVIINREVARLYYSIYTPRMTPTDISRVFTSLLPQIPMNAIKIRTVVEQARFCGLSNYVIIRDASNKYATFEWGIVEALYPGQFANYRAASIAIAGNPYYSYRHGGMGDAASTRYAILGWTARSLLIETGDQPELNRYGNGYNRNKYPRIAQAIRRFVNRPLPVNEDGNLVMPGHEYWTSCRDYIQQVSNYNTQAMAAVENEQPLPVMPEAIDIPATPEVGNA